MTIGARAIAVLAVGIAGLVAPAAGWAQESEKPNILVIWGDDIGQFNISAYNLGMMGYRTPNIDSIAADGALFTDWYGEQSCTAGRAGVPFVNVLGAADSAIRLDDAAARYQLGVKTQDGVLEGPGPRTGELLSAHAEVSRRFLRHALN